MNAPPVTWREGMSLHRDCTPKLLTVIDTTIQWMDYDGRQPMYVRWTTELVDRPDGSARLVITGFMVVTGDESIDYFDTEGYGIRSQALWAINP